MFDSLVVFITTTNDVIFFLEYPVVFLVPVRLQLIYFEEGGMSRTLKLTPSMEYVNTSHMNYIAFNSQVPFDKFQVEISLVHGSVVGPGRNTLLVYGE